MAVIRKKFSLAMAGFALALGAVAVPIALDRSVPAYAQTSSKATVDAAKSKGIVGETSEGFLALVQGSASKAVEQAVADINIQRKSHYTALAEKSGESLSDVGKAFAITLIERVPPGQMVRGVNGVWGRK